MRRYAGAWKIGAAHAPPRERSTTLAGNAGRTDSHQPGRVSVPRGSLVRDTGRRDGCVTFLVPVRGYEKGCSAENVEFFGTAA
jgi:hypothetical protein